MTRPIIVVTVGHYLPGFKMGGPLRSIVNLVDNLSDEFDFRILSADRDMGDTESYRGIVSGRWTPSGRALVYYTPPAEQTLSHLARIITETPHDLLYLNSFFSPRFTILPLMARKLRLVPRPPLVIAPRGEFSPGALALKQTKKRAYMSCAKALGLASGAIWQASSAHEVADIRAALSIPVDEIRIATNLPAPLPSTPPLHEQRSPGAPLRIVFLSRISPMKNLDYALRVLAQVTTPVSFSIYGPPEDLAYLTECEKIVAKLPHHVKISWRGAVDPTEVPSIMAAHDLFFLPTRGENFGHVIAEALGAGTPVLLSDRTPWRGLHRLGVGDDLPLDDPLAFIAVIERMAAEPPQKAAVQRAQAFFYARQRQRDRGDVEASRQLFSTALKRRSNTCNSK